MRLEYRKGTSSKFWEPSISGSTLTVRFGKIGTDGQTRATKLASPAAATAALEKLIAEKRGKGYAPAGKAKAARPEKQVKGRAELLALATELGGPAIAKEVAFAADDPAGYLAKTKHELFEDAADDFVDDKELPWLALIEALQAKKRMAEVDWKECASEVLSWLETIGGAAAKQALKPAHAETEEELDERYTDEALALYGWLLGKASLALIQLDKGSDSYAIMIVPAKDAARLAKTAKKPGYDIEHWSGKDLPALEARRFKKDKKRQTTNPWGMLVVENEHARGNQGAADSILFDLRHDRDGELLAKIRAALPSAPQRDQALIAMTLALYDEPAAKVAKTTTDPLLCLRALKNVREAVDPYERIAAAAILAERIPVTPANKNAHTWLCEACNLWAAPKLVTGALKKLSVAARGRLARLAEAKLVAARWSRWGGDGFRAIKNVGDADSLPLIAALAQKAIAEEKRTGIGYGDNPPWEQATALITARVRALR